MHKQYLRHTWVNPKLRSGESKIHGKGVFADEKIAKGEKLMEFGGELISEKQAYSGKYRNLSIWQIDLEYYLALPNSDTEESLDENLNHSCDANVWLIDEVTIAAMRDMEPGEEITLDQGTWNFDDDEYTDDGTPCFCGAKDCRRILTENDWKNPKVQEKYYGHFHPLVQKLINQG